MSAGPRLSVVLPARDEVHAIGGVFASLRAALVADAALVEVVLVDDGSVDGTSDAARAAAAAAGLSLRIVRNDRSLGYGGALRAGFAEARGEYVFFTDADGQFPLGELPDALARARPDVAILGFRARRADPLGRRLLGAAWSALVRARTGVRVRDVNCAFKLFPRAALDVSTLGCEGAGVSAELLAELDAAGLRFVELPVEHRPRTNGHASGAHPSVALRACLELVTLAPRRVGARRAARDDARALSGA